jgi:hypothetical protein
MSYVTVWTAVQLFYSLSLFPPWYTILFCLYTVSGFPLSSTCFRPHKPIIRRSKLYMQPVVLSPPLQVSLSCGRWERTPWHILCLIAAFFVFWALLLLPLTFTLMYLGVRCFTLHVLLYHMATLYLYNFVLMFLYRCRCFACSALQILTHWGRGHLNCLNARSRGF